MTAGRAEPGTQAAMDAINVLVLVAIATSMGGAVFYGAATLMDQNVSAQPAAVIAVSEPGSYEIELLAGDPVPLATSILYIEIDGQRDRAPLANWILGTSNADYWRAGERICIIGNTTNCAAPAGKEVQVTLVIGHSVAAEHTGTVPPKRLPPMTTNSQGIHFPCARDPLLQVLGTNITMGKGGPKIDVALEMNNGTGYQWLFNGDPIQAGQTYTPHMDAGSTLSLRGTASYNSWSRMYEPPDPHIVFLRDGDTPPNPEPFDGQQPLSDFLGPYVDTDTQTMRLEADQVIVLMEFAQSLASDAADFQDAVILVDVGHDPCLIWN